MAMQHQNVTQLTMDPRPGTKHSSLWCGVVALVGKRTNNGPYLKPTKQSMTEN